MSEHEQGIRYRRIGLGPEWRQIVRPDGGHLRLRVDPEGARVEIKTGRARDDGIVPDHIARTGRVDMATRIPATITVLRGCGVLARTEIATDVDVETWPV